MNPLKDCDDYYLKAVLFDDTSSFTINDLYESFKTAILEELRKEFEGMLNRATACPKCHKIHFESGKCKCGLEIIV